LAEEEGGLKVVRVKNDVSRVRVSWGRRRKGGGEL